MEASGRVGVNTPVLADRGRRAPLACSWIPDGERKAKNKFFANAKIRIKWNLCLCSFFNIESLKKWGEKIEKCLELPKILTLLHVNQHLF